MQVSNLTVGFLVRYNPVVPDDPPADVTLPVGFGVDPPLLFTKSGRSAK